MHRRQSKKLREAADAFYRVKPTAESNPFLAGLAAVGTEKMVEVWPENWPAFVLFSRVNTQWRVGMGGASGLDYSAVYPLIDRQNLPPNEWDQIFTDIQTLEAAALATMNEKQNGS